MFSKTLQKLRRFAKDSAGNMSLEMALLMPFAIGLVAAGYAFHDGFREKTININAAYTISDALSRETDPITPDYMDGMHELLEFLTGGNNNTALRVTMVRWNKHEQEYRRDWSKTRGPMDSLTNHDLNDALVENLPDLLHNERVIVVETATDYLPPIILKWGYDGRVNLYNFAFTRPRFAPKLVWDGS